MSLEGTLAVIDIHRAPTIEVEHLTDLSVDFEPVQIFSTPMGTRLNYVVKRGVVEGPLLRGEVLPGGGDWIVAGSDRVARLDIRATIKTHDDQLVYCTFTGRGHLGDAALDRFYSGELIAWDELYARSAPLFDTGAEAYSWLNRSLGIAVSQLSLSHADHRIFLVR
jgi:hypothetical protein